jgi:rhamnulokinase
MLFIAVDLGAGSGRVFIAGMEPGELLLEEVRRFRYPPRLEDGRLRWDMAVILGEIRAGLRDAAARARDLGRSVASVGADSWGVDYGLVDAGGRLLENPVCYRDARTAGVMPRVFARVPRAEIFARTGIQFLPFNTIYQLAAHQAAGIPAGASRLLLIPDLVHALLTGRAITEFTNATTTQLVNAATGAWDDELVRALGLPRRLLGEIVPPGHTVGPLTDDVSRTAGLRGVPVVAPATHDTASAVAGTPLEPGHAYISSGTWSLVGIELGAARIDVEVARHDFTNEGGVGRRVRFLKNVMGLWILESCRAEWAGAGLDVEYEPLLARAAALERCPGVIFPDDPRLLNPPSMLAALAEQMIASGQQPPSEPHEIARLVLDSLALRYASVLRTIASLTGQPLLAIHIVGGGSRNTYLNDATAFATGLPVMAGPVEATVIGNVAVQAMTAGRFADLADARRHVAANVRPAAHLPRALPALAEAADRYAALEARFSPEDGRAAPP